MLKMGGLYSNVLPWLNSDKEKYVFADPLSRFYPCSSVLEN